MVGYWTGMVCEVLGETAIKRGRIVRSTQCPRVCGGCEVRCEVGRRPDPVLAPHHVALVTGIHGVFVKGLARLGKGKADLLPSPYGLRGRQRTANFFNWLVAIGRGQLLSLEAPRMKIAGKRERRPERKAPSKFTSLTATGRGAGATGQPVWHGTLSGITWRRKWFSP